jgi:hypothetical protein
MPLNIDSCSKWWGSKHNWSKWVGSVALVVPTLQEYDPDCGLENGRNPSVCGLPSGRWSLLDMLNFSLQSFVVALMTLSNEVRDAARHAPEQLLSIPDRQRVTANLGFIAEKCRQLALQSAEHRLVRMFAVLRTPTVSYGDIAGELVTLNEAIGDDIKTEYFYHYPRQKALLAHIQIAEWLPIYDAFPSSQSDIESGLDCYALGHSTAAVFHMMRAVEYGLRALARERGVSFPNKPVEWATWQEMLDQIEASGRRAARALPAGVQRDAALAFYSGAAGQVHAFKDTYRNMVMHVRRSYDDLEALRAIGQVRDFMTGLARKIGEKTKRPIRRWP